MFKWLFIILFSLFTSLVVAEDKLEIEDFANKYLKNFQDKFSYKYFKIVLDVNDNEIVIDKKYGTFKYNFLYNQIEEGEMIIEKNFNNINFQLMNKSGNTLVSFLYKIDFD